MQLSDSDSKLVSTLRFPTFMPSQERRCLLAPAWGSVRRNDFFASPPMMRRGSLLGQGFPGKHVLLPALPAWYDTSGGSQSLLERTYKIHGCEWLAHCNKQLILTQKCGPSCGSSFSTGPEWFVHHLHEPARVVYSKPHQHNTSTHG